MNIIFFDGVREIGGNKIIIEKDGTAILFDFGKRFSINSTYFNDSFIGRNRKEVHDRVATKELPPLRNFYKEWPGTQKSSIDIDIKAAFFSHAHLDHIGLIDLIDDAVEKYMSDYSKEVLSFFEKKGIIKNNISNIKIADKPVKVGPFTVHPIPIDHDIPGALAFQIETPKGNIFYTGDFYFHGRTNEKSCNFVKYAKNNNPYILITEGTRFGWGFVTSLTEEQLKQQTISVLEQCNGILFANPYEPHISRIQTFFEIANEKNKKFVITPPYAFILNRYSDIGDKFAKDILSSPNTLIYRSEEMPDTWESKPDGTFVDAAYVYKNQKNIVMLLDFMSIPELIDIKPEKGALYIHSGGEPLPSIDAENAKILQNWLKMFNIPYFNIHSPGHAAQPDLLRMAKEINPEILLPIHTQIPERFEIASDNVKILEKGVIYNF
jgi:ribonuclease J